MNDNIQTKGSLSVQRSATIGGRLTVGGNSTVGGNMRIEGWLEAPNIKGVCKGLFADAEELQRLYPIARPGWWALVGASIPAEIYRSVRGSWVATGESGGEIVVDLNHYDEEITRLDDRIDGTATEIDGVKEQIDNIEHPVTVQNIEAAKLVIADEDDTPLLTVTNDGHIRTDAFDSANIEAAVSGMHPVTVEDTSAAKLIIADDDGTALLTVTNDGHIRTSGFDSSSASTGGSTAGSGGSTTTSRLTGKKFSVIGDSISTFRDTMPDTSYAAAQYPMGDVTSASQQWWARLEVLTGMTMLRNCSRCGSTVTGDTTSTSSPESGASEKRVTDIKKGSAVPDILIILLGCNDRHRSECTLGSWDAHHEVPADSRSLLVFSDAYALMLYKVMSRYPKTRVYCCTLISDGCSHPGTQDNTFPRVNDLGDAFEDYNEAIRRVAKTFGADIIELRSCGIHAWNVGEYMQTDLIHPNAAGFALMAQRIAQTITNTY